MTIPLGFILLVFAWGLNGRRALSVRFGSVACDYTLFVVIASASACIFREYVEALKLAIYFMIPLAYFSFDDSGRARIREKLLVMLIVMGALNAVATIWQYVVLTGWSFDPSSIRLYRPDGLFGDSIISALFCNVTIAAVALRPVKRSSARSWLVVVLCLVAGVVTGARTFYYLLLLLFAYLMFSKTSSVSLRWKVALLLCAVATVALVLSPVGRSLLDTLTSADNSNGVSSRALKRQLAIEQFLGSPLLGIGTDQYASVESTVLDGGELGLHGTNPHNVYVQILAENGLAGFVPLALATFGLLARIFRERNALALVLLLIYLAIAWSLGILYSVPFTSFFVALECALVSEGSENDEE